MTTAAARTVTREERMLFDLQGYLILRQVFAPADIAVLRDALDWVHAQPWDDATWRARLPEDQRAAALPTRMEGPHHIRINGLLRLHPVFQMLVAHPLILSYLREFMGDPQLINTWSISKREGEAAGGWHRGHGIARYGLQQGAVRSLMTNVTTVLSPHGIDDGCLCVLPGSHKSAFAYAPGYEERGTLPGDQQVPVAAFEALALPGSVPVIASPGDVIIFTESLIHTGMPKTTPGLRSNIHCNWLHRHCSVAAYEPHNRRHFLLPAGLRSRMGAAERAVTAWMDLVHDPFAGMEETPLPSAVVGSLSA